MAINVGIPFLRRWIAREEGPKERADPERCAKPHGDVHGDTESGLRESDQVEVKNG
jgi:hypothetical protein